MKTDKEKLVEAKAIINGFLSLFPGPECPEQDEIAVRAFNWMKEVE